MIVEEHLGDKNVICIADMVHEICEMGPAFNDVLSFLTPFQLQAPYLERDKVLLHMNKVPTGNQEEKINNLLEKMI